MGLSEPDRWSLVGGFAGAQLMVVVLSLVVARTYRERSLLAHAAATLLAVLALVLAARGRAVPAQVAMLAQLAVAGLQLRELTLHVGALRELRPWLLGVNLLLLPLLALVVASTGWQLLAGGLAAWTALSLVVVLRAWPQSRPWVLRMALGLVALLVAAAWLAAGGADGDPVGALVIGALSTVWSGALYTASVWRSRLFNETRVRRDAGTTTDPATGLSTPLVLTERVHAARSLMRRYGHPSVLLLVNVDNLGRVTQEVGSDAGEAAMVEAAQRVRRAIGDGDVASRIGTTRIAILAEGASVPEAVANLASRVLVAGLKQPLRCAPAEFLQFRVVLAPVPVDDIAVPALLHRLGERMDEQLAAGGERRIHALGADEWQGERTRTAA